MLYNPMLFEHQYKNRITRPMNVTFAVPQSEMVNNKLILILKMIQIERFSKSTKKIPYYRRYKLDLKHETHFRVLIQ